MKRLLVCLCLMMICATSVFAEEWYEKMKFKGDFRYRMQNEWMQSDDPGMGSDFIDNYRERQRLRLRFGFDMPVNEKIKMTVRLATQGNMRSTNQTIGDNAQQPWGQRGIYIDQMFIAYQPWDDGFTVLAGKYAAPFWQISDLAWDNDINYEGYAALYKVQITDTVGLFVNLGQSQLAEINKIDYDTPDPFMNWWQPGVRWNITDELSFEGAVANWHFMGVEDNKYYQTNSRWNTTENASTKLAHGYNVSNPQLKVTYKFNPDFAVAYYQESLENAGAEKGNYGDIKGITLGSFKVADPYSWQLGYSWRRLGYDAFPDIFPDSDSYFGYTDIEGSKWTGSYCIMENVIFNISSFSMDRIDQTYHNPQNLLQYDLNIKF